MTTLQRLARRLGYDLIPRTKARPLQAQLVAVLERFEVGVVLDVGANAGQYGSVLREWGYAGRIVSFEPQAEAHRLLTKRAAADPTWRVAPPMALGDRDGEVEIEVSAESDMSSILPQTELLAADFAELPRDRAREGADPRLDEPGEGVSRAWGGRRS